MAVDYGSGELALAAICCPKSLNAQTIFKRIALSNLGVALPAQPAYRDSDDAFPLVVFLYSIGFSVAYRAVRRRHAPDQLQARPVDHAVTLDIRIRVKVSSQVNITDIDAGSMTGADAVGQIPPHECPAQTGDSKLAQRPRWSWARGRPMAVPASRRSGQNDRNRVSALSGYSSKRLAISKTRAVRWPSSPDRFLPQSLAGGPNHASAGRRLGLAVRVESRDNGDVRGTLATLIGHFSRFAFDETTA